jgi:aryl-alcohol dehydrogenase-like predicted oxidoreductase
MQEVENSLRRLNTDRIDLYRLLDRSWVVRDLRALRGVLGSAGAGVVVI